MARVRETMNNGDVRNLWFALTSLWQEHVLQSNSASDLDPGVDPGEAVPATGRNNSLDPSALRS